MDVTIVETINDVATVTDAFISHTFDPNCDVGANPPNPCTVRLNTAEEDLSDSASGIGDLVVRTKFRLKSGDQGNLAVGVDLRLPTGDDEELLGLGSTQAKVQMILSGPPVRFSPHGNIGYTFSTGDSPVLGDISNELNYTVGFDAALAEKLTINVDLLGRTIFGIDRLSVTEHEFVFRPGQNAPNSAITSEFGREYVSSSGDMTQVLGAAGVKWNIFGNFLLNVSGLFSLGNQGLQDNFTGVMGIDYTF
jgi:hypothetical protein